MTAGHTVTPANHEFAYFVGEPTIRKAVEAQQRWDQTRPREFVAVARVFMTASIVLYKWLRGTLTLHSPGTVRFIHKLPGLELDLYNQPVLHMETVLRVMPDARVYRVRAAPFQPSGLGLPMPFGITVYIGLTLFEDHTSKKLLITQPNQQINMLLDSRKIKQHA
jgi:hypothetical protein